MGERPVIVMFPNIVGVYQYHVIRGRRLMREWWKLNKARFI
jgi:hypothetical protein